MALLTWRTHASLILCLAYVAVNASSIFSLKAYAEDISEFQERCVYH